MAPGTRILLPARAQREAPGPRRAGFPGTSTEIDLRVQMGLTHRGAVFQRNSSTALESTGAARVCAAVLQKPLDGGAFVADFRPRPERPRCSNRRGGATFAAPPRQASDNARQTLGPVGVREMSSTIWAKSFSLPSIAMSACARTPTSVLSSSTTGKRRT